MSTFLVSLGVVAATIAAVVHVVLNSPDQPATIRRQPSRAMVRRSRRAGKQAPVPPAPATPAPAAPPRSAVSVPTGPTLALPDSDMMRLRVLPAGRTTLWVRIRSSVVLVVLVAVLGALLAVVIASALLVVALLIRSATG